MRTTLLGTLLALALVACAPTTVGSRSTPLDLGRNDRIETTAGATLYARISFPSGAFGFRADAFADRLAVPVGVDGSGIRITSALELVDVVAPEGWRWRVDDVWSVTRAGRPPSFDVTLRLDVPADARLGGQQLRGTLRAPATGGREPVSMVVQVVRR
jgi:hypothetical protein